MKKRLSIILSSAMLLSVILTGCSGQSENTKENKEVTDEIPDKSPVTNEEEPEDKIVDKKLTSVKVTIPGELMGDIEDFNEEEYVKENDGIKSAKLNEDNSVTIEMSKSKHKELLKEIELSIEETISDIVEGEETPYIKDIEHSKGFKEINMTVEKESYESSLDMTPFLLGMSAAMYQAYDGEDFETKINIKDVQTGEIINTVVYPDDFEGNEES